MKSGPIRTKRIEDCVKIPTGWRQTRWLHTKRSTGVEPVVTENKYRAESGTTRLQVQRPKWFSKKRQNSVLTTFNLFSSFILCFQPECPLCRESVQLSRLVFLHHYEPTWRPHVTCSNVYRQTHPWKRLVVSAVFRASYNFGDGESIDSSSLLLFEPSCASYGPCGEFCATRRLWLWRSKIIITSFDATLIVKESWQSIFPNFYKFPA